MNLGFKRVVGRKVAFCVDDIPQNAMTYLNSVNKFPLTFFVSGGLEGAVSYDKRMYSLSDLKIFYKKHDCIEVSCHSFSHNDIKSCSNEEFIVDCKRNRDFLGNELNLRTKTGFSFPRGRWNLTLLYKLSRQYKYLRTTRKFVLTYFCFRYFLPGIPCYSQQLTYLYKTLDKYSSRKNIWLVLYTHDICESPSDFGMTPEECNKLIRKLHDMGFSFVTLEEMVE